MLAFSSWGGGEGVRRCQEIIGRNAKTSQPVDSKHSYNRAAKLGASNQRSHPTLTMKKIPGNFARTQGNILAKAKGHIPTPRTDGVISTRD